MDGPIRGLVKIRSKKHADEVLADIARIRAERNIDPNSPEADRLYGMELDVKAWEEKPYGVDRCELCGSPCYRFGTGRKCMKDFTQLPLHATGPIPEEKS